MTITRQRKGQQPEYIEPGSTTREEIVSIRRGAVGVILHSGQPGKGGWITRRTITKYDEGGSEIILVPPQREIDTEIGVIRGL